MIAKAVTVTWVKQSRESQWTPDLRQVDSLPKLRILFRAKAKQSVDGFLALAESLRPVANPVVSSR